MSRPDAIRAIVHSWSPKRYTAADVAEMVGRSTATIVRWRRNGTFKPSESAQFGMTWVWLYTPDDIKRLKKLLPTIVPGRKPNGKRTPRKEAHAKATGSTKKAAGPKKVVARRQATQRSA